MTFRAIAIVDDHFSRTQDLVAMAIPTLEDFENDSVWLGGIAACRQGFLAMRVEWLAKRVVGLDAVLAQELLQLLKRYLQTFAKLVMRALRVERTLKVIDDRQQLAYEGLFLRRGAAIGFPRSAPPKIVEVSREA